MQLVLPNHKSSGRPRMRNASRSILPARGVLSNSSASPSASHRPCPLPSTEPDLLCTAWNHQPDAGVLVGALRSEVGWPEKKTAMLELTEQQRQPPTTRPNNRPW
jgi:hypothetical protein